MTPDAIDEPGRSRLAPGMKLALELGPLVVFFIVNAFGDRFGIAEDRRIVVAAGVFAVATVVALAIHYALVRRLPIMPLVSGVFVVVFAGLTVALNDATFFKLKPTIVNALFGTALLAGLYWKKPILAVALDAVFDLTEEGWRKLTLRWAIFFFVLAGLNEAVWRTQSDAVWANFKVFGIMPLTVLFAIAQTPLLLRYERKERSSDP